MINYKSSLKFDEKCPTTDLKQFITLYEYYGENIKFYEILPLSLDLNSFITIGILL